MGLRDQPDPDRQGQRVTKGRLSRRGLESLARDGESPVDEKRDPSWLGSQVLRSTWNSVGIWGDHPLRLNTPWRPIVNQYREGKAKSTPGGE